MIAREKINKIKGQYLRGELTLDQAKSLVDPILKKVNDQGMKSAKKYGVRWSKLTFSYVFR